MGKYVIGVDNGGTFIKAALFDKNGTQIAIEKEPGVAAVARNGYVELDQERLWEVNCECVSRLIKTSGTDPAEIECIGIAGQGKGLYLVGDDGASIRTAITSADGRSWEYVERWKKDGTADKIFGYTNQGLYTSHPVSILAWMKDHEPENYEKIRWVFSMKDFLVYRMTGTAVGDYCNQSGGSFINLAAGAYEPEILKLLGIPEIVDKLPPLMHSAEVCGCVTGEAARRLGCLEGTKVVAGMFDVDASAIAMGVTGESELCMITGTCSVNAYIAREPVTNHSVLMNSYYCIPGYYFIEEGSNTSAGVLEWVGDILYPAEKKNGPVYELFNETVERCKPDRSQAVFLPFLYGAATDSRSRGVWLGMSPVDTREDLVRAAYEGVVFSHKWHVDRLMKNRTAPKAVRMTGGATHSAVWVQMFADVLQLPVEVVEGQELGVKGAAMAAAIGAGFYSDFEEAAKAGITVRKTVYPNPDNREIYEKKYERYLAAAENLGAVWQLF